MEKKDLETLLSYDVSYMVLTIKLLLYIILLYNIMYLFWAMFHITAILLFYNHMTYLKLHLKNNNNNENQI